MFGICMERVTGPQQWTLSKSAHNFFIPELVTSINIVRNMMNKSMSTWPRIRNVVYHGTKSKDGNTKLKTNHKDQGF